MGIDDSQYDGINIFKDTEDFDTFNIGGEIEVYGSITENIPVLFTKLFIQRSKGKSSGGGIYDLPGEGGAFHAAYGIVNHFSKAAGNGFLSASKSLGQVNKDYMIIDVFLVLKYKINSDEGGNGKKENIGLLKIAHIGCSHKFRAERCIWEIVRVNMSLVYRFCNMILYGIKRNLPARTGQGIPHGCPNGAGTGKKDIWLIEVQSL